MLFYFVFINFFLYSYAINWKAINLKNQTVYEFDSEHAPPSNIGRLRINVTNIDQDKSSNDPLIVYIVRLRWKTPLRWNENTENKTYDTICELQDHLQDKGVTIIDRSVPSDVNGLDERFSLPSSLFSLICAVRPRNARFAASWTYSKLVTIDSSTRKDDDVENGTSMVTGEADDDEANDANPLTEVTIMKEQIGTINDRPFLDTNNYNETGLNNDDEKKVLLDLLRMSKLTLIEDGQPIRTRPTNLTIQVKPDIGDDRPPLFFQKFQLQVGKSSEVITRLLMKTDASVETSSNSNSSEINSSSSSNSTVDEEITTDSQENLIDVGENITMAMPTTTIFSETVLEFSDDNTTDASNGTEAEHAQPSEEEVLLLQSEGDHGVVEGEGAPTIRFEPLDEAELSFESKVFDSMNEGIVTDKPLDFEDEPEITAAERTTDDMIDSSDFLVDNSTDIEDELSFSTSMLSEVNDPDNMDEQLTSPLNVSSILEEVKQKPIPSEEKDVLFSIPRSEFRQPTADEITDVQGETETKTSIREVLSDYDTLENEIRAAIGADEENLERLKQLFSGGFPEGLLRVL